MAINIKFAYLSMKSMGIPVLFFLLVFGCLIGATTFGGEPVSKVDQHVAKGQQIAADKDPVPMTDIYDIKAPVSFGMDPAYLQYSLYAMLTLILISLIVAGFLYWKKQRKKIEEITAYVAPEEMAFKLLDELGALDNPDGKIFYFRLSAVLRNYLHDRYKINAPEMTTEELIPQMAETGLSHELYRRLKLFLHSSDPIKFASIPVGPDQMKEDLFFVRDFVTKTIPGLPGEDTDR